MLFSCQIIRHGKIIVKGKEKKLALGNLTFLKDETLAERKLL